MLRRLPLGTRLLIALAAVASVPLGLFGLVVILASGAILTDQQSRDLVAEGLLGVIAVTLVGAVFLSYALSRGLLRPLTELTGTLDRLHGGDLSARMPVDHEDELGRLAESHNRLADALAARNRSLGLVLRALAGLSPRTGVDALVSAAEAAARDAFGFITVSITLRSDTAADRLPSDPVPGDPVPVTAPIQLGDERVGTLTATLPATRDWGPADRDLLGLFGLQLAAAIRNAQLFATAESVSELKSEFLRGVSHNLQTPLTAINAFADQLAAETHDQRLAIIVEQSDRLSRLVAQLLTVSRIEAGTLRPQIDVFALGPLVQRVWQSLGRSDHPFSLVDHATGWLAAADRDWVEQVLWALLDNALKYGGDAPIEVAVTVPDGAGATELVVSVRDHGPGVAVADRERVFERFTRLAPASADGTGLGLSVARGLIEATGGRLWLADTGNGPGSRFCFSLPAERIEEA